MPTLHQSCRRSAWRWLGRLVVPAALMACSDGSEPVGVGQEPTTVPNVADVGDPFAVDDSLARPMVAGVGDRFVVVDGGRRPSISIFDASGGVVSEIPVPITEGTGLGRSRVRAVADDRALVTGVQCATVREAGDIGDVCDPGDAFVATVDLDSQEWTTSPETIDSGPTQDVIPLGVAADGRAVLQAHEDIRSVDLESGRTETLPSGGGPTEGAGVRCLTGDIVVRGDTYTSPAMPRPDPGEVVPSGDEPFPPFGASTFDLDTGQWGTFAPAPDESTFEDSSYHLHCVVDGIVALPGQPTTADGDQLSAYRFSVRTGRWQSFSAPPFEQPSAWISVDAPADDVVAVITNEPEVGGFALVADGQWRPFVVDLDGAEARQAAATTTHVAILTQDDTLIFEELT